MARVLIVDDQEESRYFLEVLLKSKGYEVVPAANGAGALQKLKSGNFDLIISDILMPEMDGFELCRRIRRSKAWKSIPFIVYTATYTGPEDETFALKIGADRFMQKPCEPDVLLSAIEEVLQSAVRQEITSLPREEKEAYKVYSERLVRKLEQKAKELEQEVQARREAEKKAQLKAEKWRSTFDAMLDAVALLSPDGTVLQCNKRFSTILGRDIQDLVGQKCYQLIHGINNHIEGCPLLRSLKSRNRETIEMAIDERTFSVIIDPVIGKEGEIISLIHIMRDITATKILEQSLRESEENFKNVMENANDGIIISGPEGKHLYANKRASEITGYSIEELLTIGMKGLGHPEEIQKLSDILKKRIAGEKVPSLYETRIVRKDGKVVPIEVSSAKCLWQGKDASVVIIRDITEKIEYLERLKESEARYKALVERSLQALLIVQDFRIVYANERCREIIGYSVEELLSLPSEKVIALVHPEDQPLVWGRFKERIAGKEIPARYKYRVLRKDGEVRWVEMYSSLIDYGGKPAVQAALFDITDFKIAENELKESQEKYRLIAENMADVIAVLDMDMRFTYVSPSIWQLRGYTVEEAMKQTLEDVLTPDSFQKVRQIFEEEMKLEASGLGDPKRVRIIELEEYKKDGSTIWAEVSLSFLRDQEQKATGIISVSRDITEKKRAEQEKAFLLEQLQQAQKMEAIGRLAGGVAHDFNNLLTVIKAYSQLALLQLEEGDPLKSALEEVDKAADKAAGLTRQLLAFSRRQVMEFKVLDLNEVVRGMEKMLRRVLGEDIELLTYYADDLGRVKADVGQMEQVLMNLVVNARDAMPKGGKLTIETANVELGEEYVRRHVGVKAGAYVMLSVTDTGVGMSPEVKERIFEPFFTTKEKGKGTGLGLSTVYGIVKQSGGNVWVYSELGKGTTFKVYLPRVEGAAEEIRKKEEVGRILRGREVVLVVEDDEVVRKLAVSILRRFGYEVLEAGLPGEALFLCEQRKEKIDLLLTDVVMPHMSGRELAERVRRFHPELKVLYMSGYTDNAIVHHGVLESGVDFMQKPFTVDGLTRKVREVLDRKA